MEYRTVRDAPTSELIKSLVGSYDTARVVRLGGQSCILAREETIAQELDKRIPIPTAQPAPVSGWQPMESAPKDGTRFLAFGAATCRMGSIVEIVWYQAFDGGGSWDYGDGYIMRNPVGWMPLPEVPR